MRVFGLISLLLAGLIVVSLAVKQFDLFRPSENNTTKPIKTAETVAGKANLQAIAAKLNIYYVEKGKYPNNLNELEPDSQDFSIFTYQLCSQEKAIIKLNSTTMVLENGNAVLATGGGC
jgi:hypothetical protein